jgi:hypothetical protein
MATTFTYASTDATSTASYVPFSDYADEAATTTGSITINTGTAAEGAYTSSQWIYAWANQQGAEETEEERQAREAAFKRAEDLLKSCIGLEAFNRLHDIGYIELDSQKHKGRKYRIPKEHMEMIDVLNEEGEVIDRLCIHPAIDCPAPDHILSRVLLLKFAEEYTLAKADHHEPRGELVFGGIEDGSIAIHDG